MAKTDATAPKKKPDPKKAGAKMTGEDIINIDSLPSKKKKQRVADWAASYFLMTTQKGYTVNPYSKGSKNCIGVVFHKGNVHPKSAEPMMALEDLGGEGSLHQVEGI
jgi:hypothetical protein